MFDAPFEDFYRQMVVYRDSLYEEYRAARVLDDESRAEALDEQWSEVRRGCWALAMRCDVRIAYKRGHAVLLGPRDESEREAWLDPTAGFMIGEMERLVEHYASSSDSFAVGPRTSAEAALSMLRNSQAAARSAA